MPPAIPPSVQPALDQYLARIEQALPGFMRGFYLHGSITLGEYQPRFSDIDFITVVSRRSTAADMTALKNLHAELMQKYPKLLFSGSYLQPTDLGKPAKEIEPCPYFQDGVLQHGHFDINAVTWWMLKHRGIMLAGTPASELPFTVDVDAMLADMHGNMNVYWASFLRNPLRMVQLASDYGIQWVIPGVLRQFYTFNERSITSKTAACEYALQHVPERWHRLIREAIAVRNDRPDRFYRIGLLRALDSYLFLRYIIHRCNREA